MTHDHVLTIESGEPIPADVLVEHLAYALRTGLQLSGPYRIKVGNTEGYAERSINREGEVK